MSNYDGRRDDQEMLTEGRLGLDERGSLMMFLLRNACVFSDARQVLTPEHFTGPEEQVWAVCWRSCLDLYAQYGRLPPRQVILADALGRAETHPEETTPETDEEIRSFIEYAFDMVQDATLARETQWGLDLLQRFLKERHWTDHVRTRVAMMGDASPADVTRLLDDLQSRHHQVQAITTRVTASLVPDNWAPVSVPKVSTGMSFLDAPMGGGGSDAEVYGILGATGAGKTTLACGIASEAVVRFRTEAAGRAPRRAFFFCYETPTDQVRYKIISYLAQIDLNRLKMHPYQNTLSRTGRRMEYENLLLPTDPRGEYERYLDILPYSELIQIANFRGDPEAPKAGSGGVAEIEAELVRNQDRYGVDPGIVFVDYAQVACRRYLQARGMPFDKHLRHMVGGFGDECRRRIAARFNCQVWVLGQVNQGANRKKPGAKLSHADAAEASNFAENMWYCFELSQKDRTNNTVVLDCSKTRDSEGVPDSLVLELKGNMARFVHADARYMIDPNTRRVVPRVVGEAIVSAPTRSRPRRDGQSQAFL